MDSFTIELVSNASGEQFAEPIFWGIAWKFWMENPNSLLALKFKFVKGRGYDTYQSKEIKIEPKKESTVFTETGDDEVEQEEVAWVTYVHNIN